MSPANLPLPSSVKVATAPPPNTATTSQADDSPISKAVNLILTNARENRATDIHIDPQELLFQVRYRIDGTLRDAMTIPIQIAPAVTSRIKLLAGLKVDESSVPQNGRLKLNQPDKLIEAQVSVLPVVGGEKFVLRLIDDASKIRPLNSLGLFDPARAALERQLKHGQGMTIVTGPTGSGKSTTLYSILGHINTKQANISTIEDPVKYAVPGVNQVQVDSLSGMTFANSLRAVLRQDPNIIMVSELRDNETSNLAMQATMSGRMVLTGLYTKSAGAVLPRLVAMNNEPFVVASSVKCIIAQRLVRCLCTDCRESYTVSTNELARIGQSFPIHRAVAAFHAIQDTGAFPTELPPLNDKVPKKSSHQGKSNGRKVIPVPDDLVGDRHGILDKIAADPSIIERPDTQDSTPETIADDFKPRTSDPSQSYSPSDLTLYRAKGCEKCGMTGYSGRLGVFEVLEMTPEIMRLVNENASAEEIQSQATHDGMLTLQEDGFIKVLQGLTTSDEIIPLSAV